MNARIAIAAALVSACGGTKAVGTSAATSQRGESPTATLTLAEGVAVLRQIRSVDLPKGTGHVVFDDIPITAIDGTARLRSLTDPSGTRALSLYQSRPGSSVRRAYSDLVGQQVVATIGDSIVEGELRAVYRNQIVIATAEDGKQSVLRMVRRPLSLRAARPKGPLRTTVQDWTVVSKTGGRQDLELEYSLSGLYWHIAYTLILDRARPGRGQLYGSLQLHNVSGTTIAAGRIRVIGGPLTQPGAQSEVVRMTGDLARLGYQQRPGQQANPPRIVPPKKRGRGYFNAVVSVPANERRAVPIFDSGSLAVSARVISVFDAVTDEHDHHKRKPKQAEDYGTPADGAAAPVVESFVEIELGEHSSDSLPPGQLLVLERAQDGAIRPIGRGEAFAPQERALGSATFEAGKYRMRIGRSMDVSAKRERSDFSVDRRGKRLIEEVRIHVSNGGPTPAIIDVREHMYRGLNWSIAFHNEAGPVSKKGAQEVAFEVKVEPRSKRRIVYRVVYTW